MRTNSDKRTISVRYWLFDKVINLNIFCKRCSVLVTSTSLITWDWEGIYGRDWINKALAIFVVDSCGPTGKNDMIVQAIQYFLYFFYGILECRLNLCNNYLSLAWQWTYQIFISYLVKRSEHYLRDPKLRFLIDTSQG